MRGFVWTAFVVLGLCAPLPVAAKDMHWQARLSRVPIEAATAAKVTGQGHATADLRGRTLHISGVFAGLHGPATIAQLREGPYTGVRGKVLGSLSVSAKASGSVSGTLRLTAGQVDALRAGRLYIEIDSRSAPDGNLWGWLLP